MERIEITKDHLYSKWNFRFRLSTIQSVLHATLLEGTMSYVHPTHLNFLSEPLPILCYPESDKESP